MYCSLLIPIFLAFGLVPSLRVHDRQHMWVEPEDFLFEQDKSRVDDVYSKTNSQQNPAGFTRATKMHARASPSPATKRTQPDRDVRRQQGWMPQGSPKHSRHVDHLLLRSSAEDNEHCCISGTEQAGSTATDTVCCWESNAIMQAYRTAAAGTVRELASALFGRELLAVEAAKNSAAERERMLEERAKALFESQVSACRSEETMKQAYAFWT